MAFRIATTLRRGARCGVRRNNLTLKQCSFFSTNAAKDLNDPSTFVTGVTTEDLEKDPALQDFFSVNFPDYGTDGQESSTAATASTEEKEDVVDNSTDEMNVRLLATYNRAEEGSKECFRLREHQRLIPGVIYGSDPTKNVLSIDKSSNILVKTPWEGIEREMDLYTYHNFESRVYDLTVFKDDDDEVGEVHRVTPIGYEFHPVANKLFCCNFLRYFPGRPIKIPLKYINEEESAALKRGGFVVAQTRHVSCVVEDGVPIPEFVEVDCTGLSLKDVIRVDRLIFPEGVKPSKRVKNTFLVGSMFGRRADVGDDDEE